MTQSKKVHKYYQWLGKQFPKTLHRNLLILSLAVCGLWAFVEIADEVREGENLGFEQAVMDALVLTDVPPWVTEAVRDITALGSAPVLSLVVLSVAGFLWASSRRGLALWVLGGSTLGTGFGFALKQLIERPRPGEASVAVFTHSFPSGHSLMATVIFLTLAILLTRGVPRTRQKVYLLGVAALLIFLVGLSRILLGVHYPTDVLAGWAGGMTWGLGLSWLACRFGGRRPNQLAKRRPTRRLPEWRAHKKQTDRPVFGS